MTCQECHDVMDDGFQQQIDTYQHRLDHLVRDGLDLRRSVSAQRGGAADLTVMRAWQRECAATISQLSGGSKQHWLSRAYSDAFLLTAPSASGSLEAVGEADVDTIIERILSVLRQAQASLAGMRDSGPSSDAAAPPARRFTFVSDSDLRPKLEQAFMDAQAALDRGAHDVALITWASILEAILTDALEHRATAHHGERGTVRSLADLTFEARIEAAEEARLISGGCARLPTVARHYRELLDQEGELRLEAGISERDAKVTGQVLRLIIRDLTPGR